IDVPSGLPVDQSAKGSVVIRAHHTLSFQIFKLCFLMQENASFIGKVHLVDIGLATQYYDSAQTNYELVDKEIISAVYKPRNLFAHKGKFGHALIVAGSYGKMGAAVLCNKASLRSGAGLTTCHIPKCGF